MGGLGKTTLVKNVYDDESIKSYFDRHVWVVVSDYKGVKHLLIYLIKKLIWEIKEPPPQELEDMSIDDVRDFIYEFLKKTKYMIVFDDVWKLSTWEAIRSALPRKGAHGCIIVTTRSNNIGEAACRETNHVYNLKLLSEEESEMLFFKKAFPRNPCPPYLKEYAENILKRCEGLPLAIVVIGGLLAGKKNKMEEWELFSRSLSHELKGSCSSSFERLCKLFSLNYNDLPYYLKYCILYTSDFPEGGLLKKENIVRLWTTEGFVQAYQNKILEEVAEGYLNELCSRNLIQVVLKHSDGKAKAFRVHDLMRDYIASKAREQNLVTIYMGGGKQWPNKIRRLAIQNFVNLFVEKNNFGHLHSLLLSNGDMEIGMIKEILSRCRLLKVLDLRETIPDEVCKLYHLKHLCLRDIMIKLIPKSIKYLENLETLDLKNTNVTQLPKEILKLRHLIVYKYKVEDWYKTAFDFMQSCRAPYDIGSCLRCLQKLCFVDVDEVGSIKIVREIGKLTQLRKLGIVKLRREYGNELCSSIAKLTSLRSLSIGSVEELDLDYSLSSTESTPVDIIPACSFHFTPMVEHEDPLNCIEDLPNLSRLLIQDAFVEGLRFKAHGFQKLKSMKLYQLTRLKWVKVEKGCMPFLKYWDMCDCELLTELPQGIEHLTNLEYAE